MQADVVIVGGGPVGVGLAIDLAINGVSCIIVERHDSIQRIPKGQNLTPRTGEHFRRWGVTEAIRGASPIPWKLWKRRFHLLAHRQQWRKH